MTIHYKATITTKGTSIETNTASENGGGLNNGEGSTFTVESGAITGNSGKSGGGVITYKGIFNMSGGSITANITTTFCSSGVASVNGEFKMSGGSITGKTAKDVGGGICIDNSPDTGLRTGILTRTGRTITGNLPNDFHNVP
jgi:hypothetical protein